MKPNLSTLCALIVVVLLLGTTTVSFAQGVTTAAIFGTVISGTGEPLPGATIMATHGPSGTSYGTTSRTDGGYNLPGLRVGGPYTIAVTFVGYARQERTDIYLQLSQNSQQDFVLAEEAVQTTGVTVVAEANPLLSATRQGASTSVLREQIDRLPTLSRSFQDYYKMSPYFSPSTATGSQGNALGRNSKYNNIQVDGVNFNDLFGLGSTGTFGGQATTKTAISAISLDAIEEFQLVVSPYDVRQGDFTGAGINAVTRSGTNRYTGSVYYFGRSEGITGLSPVTAVPLRKKLDGFTDYQTGGRVGGPIIENKLFFFANGEIARFKQPFSRTFDNQTISTNAFTAHADSLLQLANYLKSRYNYDPGSFTSIPPISESEKLFFRFDYNLSESHKLTARYNYLNAVDDNSPSRGRSTTDIYFENGRYKLQNRTHSIAVQLSSLIGRSISNEFILGYNDQFDNPVYYGQAFPTLYISTRGSLGGTQSATPQTLVLGAEQFRHYNELGQKVTEITDNFSLYLPGHTITLGAKGNLIKFRNLFIPSAFGSYTYSSIAQFLQDLPPTSYEFRYSATSNPLQEANWTANQWGFFLQDEWTPMTSLKVTAGVRMDIPQYPDKPNYNKRLDDTLYSFYGIHYRTDTPPKTTPVFSPRIGFNWAVDENRTAQLRGGIGMFSGRFPFVWVSNQYSNTGVDFYTRGRIVGTDSVNNFIADPYHQPIPAASVLPSAEVDLTDRDFKAPSILRWNLAFDYKLPYDLVAGVEAIFSTTKNDVYTQNINLKGMQSNADSAGTARTNGALTPGGRIRGENRAVWGVIPATGNGAPAVQWIDAGGFAPGIFLVRNTSQGFNRNLTVNVQRNASEGLNGILAYTWGMAKDINSNNSTTASSQWRFNPTSGDPNNPILTYSQWDRRHHVLGSLSYRINWGMRGLATTVGLYYNGQSGRPYSYMVVGDVNGDGRTDNDLVYIPKDVNDIVLVDATGAVLPKTHADYKALFDFINADDYLREHKGEMSERSGPREPWSSSIDLRIAQEVPTIAGHKFELTIDILNVMNLLDGGAGWVRNTGINQTVNMLQFRSFDISGNSTTNAYYGRPRYQWLGISDPFQPDNILSRWQMQIGLRYTL
jgi:hypothetical protein